MLLECSTIGFKARNNMAFRLTDEAKFLEVMTADIPPPPPEAARNRAINSGQLVSA
jgi:hydroxyacylglutathione hydrolase